MKWNDIDSQVQETRRFIGLKLCQDGDKHVNILEELSAVASMR